jgi:transposase
MQLVERQVIKPNHRFYPEADRLSFLSNKLYNCDNYIYGQNFFSGQPTNALAVDRALKKSLNDKALPAQVTHKTLPLLLKTWTSYHSVKLAGAITIAPLSFKQHRKSLIKKFRKKESRGDM